MDANTDIEIQTSISVNAVAKIDRGMPTPASPPHLVIPPPVIGDKRSHSHDGRAGSRDGRASEAVNADALSRKLNDYEGARSTREKTPTDSPRKRQRVYGDRSVR